MKFYKAISNCIYFNIGDKIFFITRFQTIKKSMYTKKEFDKRITYWKSVDISNIDLQNKIDNFLIKEL